MKFYTSRAIMLYIMTSERKFQASKTISRCPWRNSIRGDTGVCQIGETRFPSTMSWNHGNNTRPVKYFLIYKRLHCHFMEIIMWWLEILSTTDLDHSRHCNMDALTLTRARWMMLNRIPVLVPGQCCHRDEVDGILNHQCRWTSGTSRLDLNERLACLNATIFAFFVAHKSLPNKSTNPFCEITMWRPTKLHLGCFLHDDFSVVLFDSSYAPSLSSRGYCH